MPSGSNPNSWKNLKLGSGWNKGMSKSNGDNLSYGKPRSETTKQLISQALKGKTKSLEHRQNLSKARIALFDFLGRSDRRVSNGINKLWRQAVLKRDNYTCRGCGCKEKLTCHHIKSWAKYRDLRYDMDNGIVLCVDCHRKTDTWGKHHVLH